MYIFLNYKIGKLINKRLLVFLRENRDKIKEYKTIFNGQIKF